MLVKRCRDSSASNQVGRDMPDRKVRLADRRARYTRQEWGPALPPIARGNSEGVEAVAGLAWVVATLTLVLVLAAWLRPRLLVGSPTVAIVIQATVAGLIVLCLAATVRASPGMGAVVVISGSGLAGVTGRRGRLLARRMRESRCTKAAQVETALLGRPGPVRRPTP